MGSDNWTCRIIIRLDYPETVIFCGYATSRTHFTIRVFLNVMCKSRPGVTASAIAITTSIHFFIRGFFRSHCIGYRCIIKAIFRSLRISVSGTVFVGETDQSVQLESPAFWTGSRKMRVYVVTREHRRTQFVFKNAHDFFRDFHPARRRRRRNL